MRILFLPKYNYSGPSSRYRTHQFIPFFEERGITCDVNAFFPDSHIEKINAGKRGAKLSIVWNILRRFNIILKARKYDLLIIEKEMIPYFPGVIEWIFKLLKIRYILDYDDAIFHNYDKNGKSYIRFFLSLKMPNIMSNAAHIITGSTYLYKYAKQFTDEVIKIPTVIDINKYSAKDFTNNNDFVIGWVGSYYTSQYVVDLFPALDKFTAKYNVKIRLMGFNKALLPISLKDRVEIIEWNEKTEVEEIAKFTVGIAPLHNTPFARGKCAFKSVQYLACGIPFVTSPIEANAETVAHDVNGFHAKTNDEWFKYLEYFYLNRDKVIEFGMRNRKVVEERYTIQSQLPVYVELFNQLIRTK